MAVIASTGPFIVPGPPSPTPVQLLIALENQDSVSHTVTVNVSRQSFGAPPFTPVIARTIFDVGVTLSDGECNIVIVPASPVSPTSGFDANDILKVTITGEFGIGLIEGSVVGRYASGVNEPTMFIRFEEFVTVTF